LNARPDPILPILPLGASFNSIDPLTQAINEFIAADNDKATPFVWRKREVKGSQLRNTIANLRN
jgi:hypothetical protein